MATQPPKKSTTPSSQKSKKPTSKKRGIKKSDENSFEKSTPPSSQKSKKPTPKRKPRKQPASNKRGINKRGTKKRDEDRVKKSIFTVLGVLLMILMVIFGYFLGQKDISTTQTSTQSRYTVDENSTKKHLLEDFSTLKTQKPQIKKYEVKQVQSKNSVSKNKHPIKKEHQTKKAITVKEDSLVKVKPQVKEKELKKKPKPKKQKLKPESFSGKPKLAIVIDDVSNARQLKKIKALHMKMTPSIFPPFEHAMKSHMLARGLRHYMIHLPMESRSKQFNKQYKTLKTTYSKKQIVARAKELRQLFPTAKYVNNHTGSVFTNDYKKMLILYTALKKEGFRFIDSRTIGSSKVPKIAKKFGDVYMGRDVFIDNVHNVQTIHKQLRKAVEVAKKRGHAIAIGHPHDITMKALSRAGRIFEDVELVYIDDLMRR